MVSDLANENIGHPVWFEFKTKKEKCFSICLCHVIFVIYILMLKKNESLFIWNLNFADYPKFYLVTIPVISFTKYSTAIIDGNLASGFLILCHRKCHNSQVLLSKEKLPFSAHILKKSDLYPL